MIKDFLVLFREEDGRATEPPAEVVREHQSKVKNWIKNASAHGLVDGRALSLKGKVIRNQGRQTSDGPYAPVGKEIVGGYMLIKAENLEAATELIKSCPVFEFDGFAEIREMM
jgi:hypothetical protein